MNRFPSPLGIPRKGVSFCLWLVVFPFHTPFSFPGISACSCVESFGLGGISAETSAGTGSPAKAPALVGQLCPRAPDSSLPGMELASPWSCVGWLDDPLRAEGKAGLLCLWFEVGKLVSLFLVREVEMALVCQASLGRFVVWTRCPEVGSCYPRILPTASVPAIPRKGHLCSEKVLLAPGLESCGLIFSSSLALARLSLYFADSFCYL